MKIGPVDDAGKLIDTNGQPLRKSAQEVKRSQPPTDSLELSHPVKDKLSVGPVPDGLPGNPAVADNGHLTARLQRVVKQIEAGFYEQQEIKEKTIERLIDEMLENIREFYE